MPLKSESETDFVLARAGQGKLEWLLLLFHTGQSGRERTRLDLYFFKHFVGASIRVHTLNLNLVCAGAPYFQTHFLAPFGSLIPQFLHQHAHHVIAFCVDTERGKAVQRCFLQVHNHEIAAIASASCRHVSCRRHSEGGSHREAEICAFTVSKT